MLGESGADRGSQISVLRDGERSLLYCCHSRRTGDMAGNVHVLSVGVDLVPALSSHGVDADAVVAELTEACQHRGEAKMPDSAKEAIRAVAAVLNIAWIADADHSFKPKERENIARLVEIAASFIEEH